MSLFLGISPVIDSDNLDEYKNVFLEKELRHNYYEDALTDVFPELEPTIHQVYEMMKVMAKGNPVEKASSGLISSLFFKKKVVTDLLEKKKRPFKLMASG